MRAIRIQPGQRTGTLVLSFSFDRQLIDIVKQIPGRAYQADWPKTWTIPDTPENLAWLRARLPANVELRVDQRIAEVAAARSAGIERAQVVRDAGDSSIEFDYRTEPYAHQRAGLEFLTHIGSGALLWEMGLGKTKTAIDYAEYLKARSPSPQDFGVLVICPNTVKRNWVAEVAKHAGHDHVVVPTGSIAKRITQLGTSTYTIVNCEVLSIADMAKELRKFTWDLVIVDESTRFKSHRAARTKTLHKLNAKRRLILTGTPITNSADDAWAQFEFVTPGLLGSHWAFEDRFLKKDWFGKVEGIKPGMESELASRLESRSYRILKSQVLDLPPKVYTDRLVTLEGAQKKAYDQMRDDLRIQLEQKSIEAFNVLTQLLRLTQITAGLLGEGDRYEWLADKAAKVRELDNLLNDELRHESVVVFGLYQRELEELAARYTEGALETVRMIRTEDAIIDGNFGKRIRPGAQLPIIYGPTPEKRRHELVEEFQRGERRLLFIQTRTGGIGINLTAAKNAVYHTRGWSLEEYLQSQDRLHRIGQTGTVNIIHLTAEGTVDERIAEALASKQNLADTLTGDAARRLAAEVLGD